MKYLDMGLYLSWKMKIDFYQGCKLHHLPFKPVGEIRSTRQLELKANLKMKIVYNFAVWTENDFLEAGRLLGSDIEEVKTRYAKFGGIPRYCFGSNDPPLYRNLNTAIAKWCTVMCPLVDAST